MSDQAGVLGVFVADEVLDQRMGGIKYQGLRA